MDPLLSSVLVISTSRSQHCAEELDLAPSPSPSSPHLRSHLLRWGRPPAWIDQQLIGRLEQRPDPVRPVTSAGVRARGDLTRGRRPSTTHRARPILFSTPKGDTVRLVARTIALRDDPV